MTAALVVLGDVLLDVDVLGEVWRHCPEAPHAPVLDVVAERRRAGGAGLAAMLAAADGTPVRLVTALGTDPNAEVLRDLLEPHLEVVAGPARGSTVVKTRLRAGGKTLSRVDRGEASAEQWPAALADALDGAGAVLVSDYGRGLASDPLLGQRLARLAVDIPVLWDPHPRGGRPITGCALTTPNLTEALSAAGHPPARDCARSQTRTVAEQVLAAHRAAGRLRVRWRADGVAVTLGALGALLRDDGPSRLLAAPRVAAGDTCGAGDRFAVSAALALRAGHSPWDAVRTAVGDAAYFVGAGGAGSLGTRDETGSPGTLNFVG